MRTRTDTYFGSFSNDATGNNMYKTTIAALRKIYTGGRFVKMYRWGKRNSNSNTTLQNTASYFDAYMLCRNGIAPTRRNSN